MVLLFSWGVSYFLKYRFGKLGVFAFLLIFLIINLGQTRDKLTIKVNDTKEIVIQNQLEAINWIYEDSAGKDFNVDVYVPPVIPYSYDYLFLWEKEFRSDQNLKLTEKSELLYTLYEDDPPHPERLEAWLARQRGIGIVEKEFGFGGITVQRRIRI